MAPRYWPLGAGRDITSTFGPRWGEQHWGVDFGRAGGSGDMPVYAVQGGYVDKVGPASGFGQWVCLDHPESDGAGYSVYGHIIPEVSLHQRVEAGHRIGRINPDSRSNGGVAPHLHLEIHRALWSPPGPGRIDPLPWLAGAREPGDPTPEVPVTAFGIDVSNHQGAFDFAAARAEGFAFATHKITEGTWRDPWWPRARDEMALHFAGRWGGYVFCKVDTHPDLEADVALQHSGGADFPLQIDYEDLNRTGDIDDLMRRVESLTARGFELLPIYLPRWYWQRMGSPDLTGLPVGIWNSHYVNGFGFASALYPGDDHAGWAPMGGKAVDILQFSETASVAGQRIDVNAIRGGDVKLAELFGDQPKGPLMALTDEEQRELLEDVRYIRAQLGPKLPEWGDGSSVGRTSAGDELTLRDGVANLIRKVGA